MEYSLRRKTVLDKANKFIKLKWPKWMRAKVKGMVKLKEEQK